MASPRPFWSTDYRKQLKIKIRNFHKWACICHDIYIQRVIKHKGYLKQLNRQQKSQNTRRLLIMAVKGRWSLLQKCSCSIIDWFETTSNGIDIMKPTVFNSHIKLECLLQIQYIPRNMHTVFALLCFVVVIHWLIFPYPSGLLHWHCGNLTIAPVPAKQPWWIWINTSCEFIMNDCITTKKQSTTKPCAYFLGYTVLLDERHLHAHFTKISVAKNC